MKKKYAITLFVVLILFSAISSRFLYSAEPITQAFKLPAYEKYVMTNGLTIYLMEQHEVPLIYISAVFPAGAVRDEDKYGMAYLTAQGLLFGTKNYTKKQIEESLDFIGATYSSSASKEYASLSMSFVASDQATVLPILKDIIVNPVFDKGEFEKRKKRLLTELQEAKERPRSVIGNYYNKFLFGKHVYANPVTGTVSSVNNISVENVEKFYESYYSPSTSAIAIVGDFKISEMKVTLQKLFKDWREKDIPGKILDINIPSYNASRLLLINKEDATETQFRIGSFGIKRSNPDYVAVQVVNTILGGRFTSWLNDELRVNRGLTYGARSYFDELKESGIFAISSFTRTETTLEAIDVALEVLQRLHNQGIDNETLSSAKNYIKGQFPPDYETAGDLAALFTEMYVYNFDESFINDFQKNVDEMTVEKSQQIIAKYFPKENLQFVLIGKSSEIREAVKKYGSLTEKEINANGF
jgi:predicted Zn-dependent peptidase